MPEPNASEPQTISTAGVTYERADADYFKKRTLKRTTGVVGLWGIGVSAVISGDFSGWNGGIAAAGWGGFLIATLIVIVMYIAMNLSISEMAASMPHTGGAYSFARAAMGPWGGFVTGLAETIEYVMTSATIVYFSSTYADSIVSDLFGFSLNDQGLQWVWWLLLYGVFVVLNSLGAQISFRFAVVVAILSLIVIAIFGVLALASGTIDFGSLFDIAPSDGGSSFLPFGIGAIFFALPFAMWLFLGIEELPLAAEEAKGPERDIPRASIASVITLIISGAIVVILNPAVLGAQALGDSEEPLLDGFRAVLPGDAAAVISAFALIGLLASVQGIMFAYGRNLYSLSRAGYYPRALSLTGKRQTPYVALIVGAVIGFAALFIIQYGGDGAGSVVLNIAVWGAVVSYLLQMVAYVLLRKRMPNIARPFRSPFGVPGAVIAGLVSLVIFIGVLLNPSYTLAVYTIVVIYVVALIIFAVWGRKRLVLSPEEEFAVSGGAHGNPEREGYDDSDLFVHPEEIVEGEATVVEGGAVIEEGGKRVE
ncbi:MAG: Amino acid permease [Pseudoclavibacter caeni]|jgi:ethanolamine permease